MPRARRTRLALAAALLAGLAVAPLGAHAGSSGARFADPAGDMAVPSLDVVSGEIRVETTKASRLLTMTAAVRGDLTGAPADYDLVVTSRQGTTCYAVGTRVRWNGVTLAQSYLTEFTVECDVDLTPQFLVGFGTEVARHAVGGEPVDASAGGRTVQVRLPAPAWLAPGVQAGYGVVSHTPGLALSSSVGSVGVANYDMAGLGRPWRVG